MAVELDALIREHRIRLFLGARLASAARTGDRLDAAVIEDRSGRRAFVASQFIDASGDGDLLRRAGFEAWQGSTLQPVTMQALMGGIGNFAQRHPRHEFVASDPGAFRSPQHAGSQRQPVVV